MAAILAEGRDEFERVEQSRALAESHFDLRRIRAARYDVFLRMGDLEKGSASDLETALHAIDKINRYETRALSRSKRALLKSSD